MAVSAIELKPRGPLALFDSAVRLCARSSGVWALTLPGGAVVTWALLRLADAIHHRADVLVPAGLFTVAWLVRGVFMGAACHYLDELVIGTEPPTTWRSLRAALQRLPSLLIAAVYLPFFTALSLLCTAGLAFFFLSSHIVGYAVTMKGKGHPLALYGTCSRLLGPARVNASMVRWLFTVIVLVGLNLHVAANGLIFLGRKLIGLDLTYAQRFASLDNAVWVTVVAALAFALFEPLRAAVGTLLLIDGRVRQEGLDLVAAVEQLPKRKTRKGASSVAAAVLVCLVALGAPSIAHAQSDADDAYADEAHDAHDEAVGDPEEPVVDAPDGAQPGGVIGGVVGGAGAESHAPPTERLIAAAEACRYSGDLRSELRGADRLSPAEQQALRRLADDVDLYTWSWQDCGTALDRLGTAMPLVRETIAASDATPAPTAAEKAKEILARPEFVPIPDRVAQPDADTPEEDDPNSAWAKFQKWWRDLLDSLFKPDPDDSSIQPPPTLAPGSGMAASNFIVVLMVIAVVILLCVVLYLAFRSKGEATDDYELEQAAIGKDAPDEQSALSRPPEGWSHLADELAAQGDFRAAVRSLYLALLSRLHRIGAIDYDPTLSNWDYCRQFRGHREWVPTFKDLTLRFDFAWYGHLIVDRDGYTAFKQLTEPILSAPVQSGGGAPHA